MSGHKFVNQRIGQYVVKQKLGEGGMGLVYLAEEPTLGRRVAIKFLHPDFSCDAEILNRFVNEGRAANLVRHPGLLQILEFGALDNGIKYLVMEYLAGESLERRLSRHNLGLPLLEVLWISWQLSDVLATLHQHGLIHRDVKPSNVMMTLDPLGFRGERVKLLDLGLVQIRVPNLPNGDVTRPNVSMGTPIYMSPEQCLSARDVDGRTDVYALGVMIFEMLSGRPPLVANDLLEQLQLKMREQSPPLASVVADAPPALCELVDQMLRADCQERPHMAEVRDRLSKLLETSPSAEDTAATVDPDATNQIGLQTTLIASKLDASAAKTIESEPIWLQETQRRGPCSLSGRKTTVRSRGLPFRILLLTLLIAYVAGPDSLASHRPHPRIELTHSKAVPFKK